MVKSARVQKVVAGDDVVLQHQIVETTALVANEVLAPVLLQTGDVVTCFYQRADGLSDIGYAATPTEALPTSKIQVIVAGDIPPNNPVPETGTKMFAIGLAQTVRVEILRQATSRKETHYLMGELDVVERGFPTEAAAGLDLP